MDGSICECKIVGRKTQITSPLAPLLEEGWTRKITASQMRSRDFYNQLLNALFLAFLQQETLMAMGVIKGFGESEKLKQQELVIK